MAARTLAEPLSLSLIEVVCAVDRQELVYLRRAMPLRAE
jgi:hypothetical protein